MSLYNKAGFEAVYAAVLGTFADNTTRNISEGDLRQFAQDIADSLFGVTQVGTLSFAVVDIGDWDMDSTLSVTVSLPGGLTRDLIRSVSVQIRSDDLGSGEYTLWDIQTFGTPTGSGQGGYFNVNSGADTISLTRIGGGHFDQVLFDQTSWNRGWITIAYEN